ncbi:MAG: hypothetical protein AMXMBFR66_01500 [Pseudomonadota bacterium]|nr:DUF3445 domain-containing protein [Rubrivivax sp.]
MFDFEAAVQAPFRMQPGLRRLAPAAPHLTPLAPGSRHQREKLAVLSAYWPQALLRRPDFDAEPALDALSAHAAAEQPQAWRHAAGRVEAPLLGTAVEAGEVHQTAPGRFGLGDEVARCLHGLPPAWRRTALLSLAFAEDFALVDAAPGAGAGSVPWLAVALPSHWAPERVLGLHFAQIHAAVPETALLQRAGQALVGLVAGAGRCERFVWNVTDQPRLHAHPERTERERWCATPVERAWLRHERQTFIALPALRQALFTIRVGVSPLADIVSTPERAARLHAAVTSMSPQVLAYRGLVPVRDALLEWLARRAAHATGTAGATGATGATEATPPAAPAAGAVPEA